MHRFCKVASILLLRLPSLRCVESESCQNKECYVYQDVIHRRQVNLNLDENGEYRALKFNRKFGVDAPSQRPLRAISWQQTEEFAKAVEALERDGAIVLKRGLEPELLSDLQLKVAKLLQDDEVAAHISNMELDNSSGAFYNSERQVGDLRIRKGTKGRYDMKSIDKRDGGALAHDMELPESVEPLLLPPLVRQFLSSSMDTPWRLLRAGILTSLPGAAAGDWHRDIGEGLFGEAQDISLPEYYFNALWPLDSVTAEQGTELVLRSHKVATLKLDPSRDVERVVAVGDPGDVVFFNGKMIHRGMPNPTNMSRSLIYCVYAAKWFEQGRDQSKEYWGSTSASDVRRKKVELRG